MEINELLELQKQYRRGEIQEEDLTEHQIDALGRLYDVQIRSLNAINNSRKVALKHEYEELVQSGTATEELKAKMAELEFSIQKNRLKNYSLISNKKVAGLELFQSGSYLSTYLSYEDLIWDLSFYYAVIDFEELIERFISGGAKVDKPHKYRGTCTTYENTEDKISAYVHYADSLQELLAYFEEHEKQALEKPNQLSFSPFGTEIYLYSENERKYLFWLGGREIRSVSDVLRLAHTEKKLIPSEATQELSALNRVDVFISHKSQDFTIALKLYNHLLSCGIHTFLSEMSLPALSDSDYSFEIDAALEKAKNVIVIASSRENVLSGWVKYEWTTFANEKRSGRKNGSIVTLLSNNMDVSELPILLRQFEVLSWDNYRCATNFLLLDN